MPCHITNQTIWITGATSGIGQALAFKLADAGNFVIISGRRESLLDEMVARYPHNLCALPMDVANSKARGFVAKQLEAITDVIDIVIMSAGTVSYEDDLVFDDDEYRQVFDTNFFGMVNTVAIAKPLLERSSHKAYIVGVSSLSMVIGFPRAEIYGASKAAADYFLHSLSVDLPKRKYDISIVRPGFVKTPMTDVNDFPMPFLISAEDAADRMIKGMEKRRRVIAFPRRLNVVIQLLSWLPCLWYGYLGPKSSRARS